MAKPANSDNKSSWSFKPSAASIFAVPPRLLSAYDGFVTKNASQVSQIESAMRSLTYIIPGRFRDAELASESIQSGVQLLSLYHDNLLRKAHPVSSASSSTATSHSGSKATMPAPSLHTRYTRFWAAKSAAYRRVSLALQVVQYTELLLEMAARRKGEKTRWRVVVLIEAVKALCKLLLLRITKSRPLVIPALPERVVPLVEEQSQEEDEEDDGTMLATLMGEELPNGGLRNGTAHDTAHDLTNGAAKGLANGHGHLSNKTARGWEMPRTGLRLPALPPNGDTSAFLLSRVLTADDIKPATKLVSTLSTVELSGEALYILAPLIYAILTSHFASRSTSWNARSSRGKTTWTPYIVGLSMTLLARHLATRRASQLRGTQLEREEWSRRTWSMGWWLMKSPAYDFAVKGVLDGVKRRMPSLVGNIIDDYEYLWENYHFSTSND